MKVLSLNFVNCAAKACKSTSESFPLHPKDAELVQDDIELNPAMLINVLPRLDWAALRTTSSEVSKRRLCFLVYWRDKRVYILLRGGQAASCWSELLTMKSEENSLLLLLSSRLIHRDRIFTDLFAKQLGFPQLPEQAPTAEELQADEKTLKDLHHLLLETQISEGKLVCGNCGHEYAIKEGIANFLLPSHLV